MNFALAYAICSSCVYISNIYITNSYKIIVYGHHVSLHGHHVRLHGHRVRLHSHRVSLRGDRVRIRNKLYVYISPLVFSAHIEYSSH